MRKALSRFLLFMLLVFVAVLGVTCAMYLLHDRHLPIDLEDAGKKIPALSSETYSDENYSRIEDISLSSVDEENDVVSTYGYDSLTDKNAKYLYERLRESVYKISEEVDDKGRYKTERVEITGAELDSQCINTAINAFLYDNPQVFWVDNYFGYYTTNNTTYVECYSVLSGNQCEIYLDRFSKKVREMLSVIDVEDGKYEREKKLHDKLLENCQYKKDIDSFDDGWQYFSSYGALVEGEAVCEGYSKAMMLMLNLSGVDAATIRGEGEGSRHMWNLVEIGGNWYHLDATWDDGNDDYNHEFFNLTSESIKTDHIIDPILSDESYTDEYSYNFFLPECESNDMNYYSVEGIVMNGTDDSSLNELVNLIYSKASADDDIVPIKVGEDMDYEEFMNVMFDNDEKKMFYECIRSANEYIDDEHKINSRTSFLLRNEKRHTARVRIVFGTALY